jgi:fused signal recognition particle receptor
LMDELKKVKRVLAKLDPEAPHEVLLVLDGTAGQNAVRQAREFRDALGVTGIVVTKLDGTARGGVLVALAAELGLPIRAIGIGESSADLIDFDPDAFAAALVGQRDAA